MVLNRVDLGKCWESFQTPWNALYVRVNGFATTFGIVPEDLGWIPKGPKSIDFDQKPCAIAYGFEQGRFGKVRNGNGNRSKLPCPLCACKWISNYFRDCSWRFVNSEGSEIHRFWPKTLGSPWFWTWPICLESFQTPWNALYVRANGFPTTLIVPEDLGWIPKSEIPILSKKGYHGFEHPGAGNRSKLWNLCACKPYFRDCSWRFGVNSLYEIHRFWPKSLG